MLFRRHKLPPRHHADNREVYRDVDERDGDYADDYRTRDGPSRLFHLVTDVTDVVVAEVIENADSRRRAQTQEEAQRKIERARRKVKSDRRLEMKKSGDNHGQGREDRSDPQTDC